MNSGSRSCLIVGAGLAGLTAAKALHDAGWRTTVIDKSRGVGGRMATRRVEEQRYDHGAQFFTVRDPRFQAAVNEWLHHEWVRPWYSEGGHTRYCGSRGMNSIPKQLAHNLPDVRLEQPLERLEIVDRRWRALIKGHEAITADALILTPPAPQTLALARHLLPADTTVQLERIRFDPCFALLLRLDRRSQVPEPGYVRPEGGPISWVADNVQKGIAPGPTAALTIHAAPDFTREHLEEDFAHVTSLLVAAAKPWIGDAAVTYSQLHRWRYSQPVEPNQAECLYAAEPAPVVVAGDAFGGPRIEGAYLSGLAGAAKLLNIT